MKNVKILIVTNMYPFEKMTYFGNFLELEVRYMKSQELDVDVLFLNGRENKFNYIKGLFSFLSIYKKYDIIHYHHTYIGWYSLFVKGKKQVFTMHEGGNVKIINNQMVPSYGHGRNTRLERLLEILKIRTRIFNKMDQIILTRYSKDPLYFKGKLVKQNPMGIDFNKFKILNKKTARDQIGIPQDKTVLFFPHEPRKEKNIELFDQIVERLKGYFNIHTLYGGKIPAQDMYLYINASDLCYLTSKFEASPTIVKESLACGVPILCSKVGDLEEILDPDFTHLLCNYDVDEFVKKSQQLLMKPVNREDLRAFIKNKGMEYQNTSQNVIDIYRQIYKEVRA